MSKQEDFAKRFGPGILPGITLLDWIRLLAANRFAISPRCFIRSASIGYCSFVNSVFRMVEQIRFDRKLRDVQIEPPIFVLGHWRNGTTHLHNLVGVDDRFACPNLYQVCYPRTFLMTESTWVSRALSKNLPDTRPMDSMALGFGLPFEDEYAICAMTLLSPYLSFAFPRRRSHYERYLTLRDVPDKELDRWKQGFLFFLKKLTFRYQRPLVLKSPTHTCRIKLLLDLFPDAKFVHIHRHPFDVFQSTQHQVNVALQWYRLQRVNADKLDDWIIQRYRRMYDLFFAERDLIPTGNFHELSFEQLEYDPITEVEKIYAALDLPDFGSIADALRDYVATLEGYTKNQFPELCSTLRNRIATDWQHAFREWDYSTDPKLTQ